MTKLNYWQRRHLQTKAKEIKNTEAYEKALQPELNGLYRELHVEMEKWYTKYVNNQSVTKDEAKDDLANVNSENWGMTLEEFEDRSKKGRRTWKLDEEYYRSRVARFQDLEKQLKQVSQSYAIRETDSMRDSLAKQFKDTYMRTNYNIQASKGGFTANFAHFNEAQLRIVVSQPWAKDGKDFSKRIWKNYQQDLPKMLSDSVLQSTLMGYGPQKASQLFHAKFQDFKKSNVHRLITSEMGHVAEEAAARSYEENEIEQYEYMATLESHTCAVCGRLDGQKFKLSERKDGINYPLIHPYCRCTTVPYIEDLPDVAERWSRDETGKGKMVKDVKFDEWKKMVTRKKSGAGSNPYFSANLEKHFGKSDLAEMSNAIGHSPTAVRKVWEKYQERMAIESIVHDGQSYFMPSNGMVTLDEDTIYARNEQIIRNKHDVVFHEFGHAIDNFSGQVSMNSEFNFKEVLDADFEAWIQKSIDDKIKEIDISQLTNKRKLIWDRGYSQGFWNGHKVIFNTETEEINRLGVRGIVYDDLNNTKKRLKDYETNGKSLSEVRSLGDISDIICAASDNKIWMTMGHSKEYYMRAGSQEKEAFAEMTSAVINNPASLEKIQQVFPNSYKVYLRMVNKALGDD